MPLSSCNLYKTRFLLVIVYRGIEYSDIETSHALSLLTLRMNLRLAQVSYVPPHIALKPPKIFDLKRETLVSITNLFDELNKSITLDWYLDRRDSTIQKTKKRGL